MIVVSFGGGTNSTAVLVGLHERGINPDMILFSDTGGERPETYAHVEEVSAWCLDIGFPEIRKLGLELTLERDCLNRNALPSIAYGFKTCSQRWKIEPQHKFLNNNPRSKYVWESGCRVTKAIGIDFGEKHRIKNYSDKKYDTWFPLVDWQWDRDACVRAIARAGLTQPGKSACFFYPSSKAGEIKALKAQHPDLAERAIQMERNADLTTVKGLGRNFSWEKLLATDDMFADEYCAVESDCFCEAS